jgi:hypothetical protein
MTSTTYPVWFDNKVYASSTVKIGGNATAGLSSLTIDAGPADSAATLFQINDNASRSLLSFATSSVYEAAVLTIGIENSPNASGDIILNHGTAGSGALFILGSGNTMSAVQALLGGDSEGGQLTLGSGTVTSTFSASYFRLGETWDSNGEAIDNGKFFINPATGNTSVSGTLHVYGSLTNDILNSNGTVYSNNGVLTNVNPSSLDYKYDVNDLDLDADKILALHIKAFKWKGTDRLDFGLIAEEIKAVAPELYVDDGITKGYRSDHLVFYLLQILQKQQARLDALSSAVNVPLNLDFQQFLTRNDNWYIDENGYFVSRFKTSEGDKEMFGLQSPAAEFVFSSSSQLIDGEAIVNFDPATREIIDPEVLLKVTVTLTSGEAKGIYVSEKNSTGFTAKELGGGRSNATFDWMVVAKRRSGQNEILPDVGTSGGENDIPTNNNVGGEDLVVPDTGSSGTASSTNGNASLTGSPPSAGGTTGENSSDNSTNGTATDGTSTDQTTDNNQTTQNISNTDSNTTNSGGQLTNSDLQQLLNVDGILPSVPESPSPATPEASESSSPTENTPTN